MPTEPSSPPAARDPLPPGSIRIGRVAGCDVIVSRTWFLIAAFVAYLVAPQVEAVRPGLGVGSYLVGAGFAVLLYASVLLHEISHAVVARRFGFPVTSITLHFLGGMTAIKGESRRPREEFWIAVVGPLTSLAVAVVGLWSLDLFGHGLMRLAVGGVAYSNLAIGILNLIPGLPLDGGRVLRSIIWGATKNAHLGTLVAGWAGRLLAVVALGWPFYRQFVLGDQPTVGSYVMAVIVAGFLWSGASASMRTARVRQRLPHLVASQLARPVVVVPGDISLDEAESRRREGDRLVVLNSAGQVHAIAYEPALRATPAERRASVPVASVSRVLDPGTVLPSQIAGEELIVAMGRRPAEEYLLVDENGQPVGVLSAADVDHAYREVH